MRKRGKLLCKCSSWNINPQNSHLSYIITITIIAIVKSVSWTAHIFRSENGTKQPRQNHPTNPIFQGLQLLCQCNLFCLNFWILSLWGPIPSFHTIPYLGGDIGRSSSRSRQQQIHTGRTGRDTCQGCPLIGWAGLQKRNKSSITRASR